MACTGLSFNDLATAQVALRLGDIRFHCVLCGITHDTRYTAWQGCAMQLQRMLQYERPTYLFPELHEILQSNACFSWKLLCRPDLLTPWMYAISSLAKYADKHLSVNTMLVPDRSRDLDSMIPWLALTYDAFYRELAMQHEVMRHQADELAQPARESVDQLLVQLEEINNMVTNTAVDCACDQLPRFVVQSMRPCLSRSFKSADVAQIAAQPGVLVPLTDGQDFDRAETPFLPESVIIDRLVHDFDFIAPSYAHRDTKNANTSEASSFPLRSSFSTLQHMEFVNEGLYISAKEYENIYLFPESYAIRKRFYHAILIENCICPKYIGALKTVSSANSYASALARATPLDEFRQPTVLDTWFANDALR